MNFRRLIPQILFTAAVLAAAEKQRTLKPGWNLFSPDQDVKMGQEYAQQIEGQVQVINNPALYAYVNRIGQRLVNAIEGPKFPFTFKVVNDPSINAFALPGGPMYVHTGLIAAADNEAQIAGVLGHEMGHVMLRHGTNQASKANLIQIPAMIAAGIFEQRGGMLGALAGAGIGLGANSVLLKFSRTAESDADLFGARLVHRAGYNPVELARFFEKLESESGKGGAMTQFFSDHPNPGNRIVNIQNDMKFYDAKNYESAQMTAELTQAKAIIKTIPAAPKRAAAQQPAQAPRGPAVQTSVPAGFKAHQNALYAIAYPGDWSAKPGPDGVSASLTAADGVVRSANGEDIGHGVILNFVKPQSNDINAATDELLKGLTQGNPNIRSNGAAQSLRIDNYTARLSPLQGPSSLRKGEKENVLVLTVMHPQGMFYGVFIAPESRWRVAEPEYRQMMQTLRFGR